MTNYLQGVPSEPNRYHDLNPINLNKSTVAIQSAVAIADTLNALEHDINATIIASKKTDWKSVSLRALTFLASAALGAMTALLVVGTMITPIGWGIAAGAALLLIVALVVSYKYGGPKELWESVKFAVTGLAIGASGGLVAAPALAGVSALALAASPPTTFLAGIGGFIAGFGTLMLQLFYKKE